jgi:hypothetical protein
MMREAQPGDGRRLSVILFVRARAVHLGENVCCGRSGGGQAGQGPTCPTLMITSGVRRLWLGGRGAGRARSRINAPLSRRLLDVRYRLAGPAERRNPPDQLLSVPDVPAKAGLSRISHACDQVREGLWRVTRWTAVRHDAPRPCPSDTIA